MKDYLSLIEISDIVFSLIPEEIQKKYEENVFGQTLTLKDRFIAYYKEDSWNYSKFSKEEKNLVKIITLTILKENMENIKNRNKFNIAVFSSLFI